MNESLSPFRLVMIVIATTIICGSVAVHASDQAKNVGSFSVSSSSSSSSSLIMIITCTALFLLLSHYYLLAERQRQLLDTLQRSLKEVQTDIETSNKKELSTSASGRGSKSGSPSCTTNNDHQNHEKDKKHHQIERAEEEEENKEIRIFMDGAFDLMHFGHMNAFRLAKSLGTHLVVGINSDRSIHECKGGLPLMNDEQRMQMVQSCKFVDQVVPNCPYVMNQTYLDWVVKEYNIDYVVHGDDPCIVDGKDVYATAKETGVFQTIPRTEGISTTDIVGRILSLKDSQKNDNNDNNEINALGDGDSRKSLGSQSRFLTTNRLLSLFGASSKRSKTASSLLSKTSNISSLSNNKSDHKKVVYIDGGWDLFNPGHVSILQAAKERGDYLLVGVHSDDTVYEHQPSKYWKGHRRAPLPILNLQERVLSVLGCCYVDDVLIDAPYEITSDMIASLHISEVIHVVSDDNEVDRERMSHRFQNAKNAGIYIPIQNTNLFSLEKDIFQRIHNNQDAYQIKVKRKKKAEQDFYEQKYK